MAVASPASRPIGIAGYVRAGLRVATMALALIAALILHGGWRLLRLPSPWPRLLLRAIGRIAGARRQRVGTPLRRDVLLLANHASWLDILVLAGATGTAFVAKGELERVPLIGWLCRLNRTVFIARGDRMGVADQVAKVRETLAAGWSLAIFPEGTTAPPGQLLPFKASLLAVLDPPPPGLAVQPVWIDYGAVADDIAWVGDEPGADNVLRVLARVGTFPVRLHFGTPLDPATIGNRKLIAAEARDRIAAMMRAT